MRLPDPGSLNRGRLQVRSTTILGSPPSTRRLCPAAGRTRTEERRVVARPAARRLELLPDRGADAGMPELELVESYRRLADVFHEVLAEQSLDELHVLIEDTPADPVPHDVVAANHADQEAR